MLEKLAAAGAEGMTKHALSHTFNSRDRHLLPHVLEQLSKAERVRQLDRIEGEKTERWARVIEEPSDAD